MRETVRKYALENAIDYDGEASVGSVIGSAIQEDPSVKENMDEFKKLVSEVVQEVNKLDVEEQRKELEEIAPELLEEDEKEKDIFSRFEPSDNVITAFPPEPSKYPHIGHAKGLFVNHEWARRNNGKFILRFEDTNPELAEEKYYDIHQRDYEWLEIEIDEIDTASEHIEEFYELAEKLIDKGKAYVCSCESERMKEGRKTGEVCEHRKRSEKDNKKAWKAMLENDDESVLRAKIDLEHKNSAMRDPTLFRVIKEKHCKVGDKYRVWPTYDFATCVMDSLEGVTMRFRTKEFEMRSELQDWIQKQLELSVTDTYEFARFELKGVETSGRVIREKVNSGELLGWDDPSLATLAALKRRGFQPKAIKDFVLSTGLNKTESVVTWDDLIKHNRRVLDDEADRYFFMEDPVKIVIEEAPEREIELHLHPEDKQGGRPMKVGDEFYIEKRDYEEIEEGELCRFMECLNFEKKKNSFAFHSVDYESFKEEGDNIMHFLPVSDDLVDVEVLMPDKTVKEGIAESNVENIDEGEVIQFERFGFCRLDEKSEDKLKFWFTHS